MKQSDLMKLTKAIDHLGELDNLLEERSRLRQVYAFFQDNWIVTGNSIWLTYMSICKGAGHGLNQDIAFWSTRAMQLHAVDPVVMEEYERRGGEDAEAVGTRTVPDL